MEEDFKKTLDIEGRTKEQKRADRDKAEYERREKRAALKAALANQIYTNKLEETTCLPLSGRLISEEGEVYHMKSQGVLTSLHLDGFENQPFLLDSLDLYRFIWQHKLKYIGPDGCIKKLFQDSKTTEIYLKNGTHCVWSPLTGFWTQLNSELLNNGNIFNTDGLPTGTYMAVESDFNISILIRVIQQRYQLTKSKLAQRLGCDVATIIFFENGQRTPSEKFLNKLAEVFPEYSQSISNLHQKNGKILSVQDLIDNLIDCIIVKQSLDSKFSATFGEEGISVDLEGIKFYLPHRNGDKLSLELEKFPENGIKAMGIFVKKSKRNIKDMQRFIKSSALLSEKLGTRGIVLSSARIDGLRQIEPDDAFKNLNYVFYELDSFLDFMKSTKKLSGTLAEAMLGVSGAVPDNNNPKN